MDLNSQHNPLIYKPLSYLIIPSDHLILYANLLSNEELVAASQNISRAPSIYQEYIEKDYELRITVIGEDIYPVKIYSQTNENTIIDWRKDQLNLEYELVSLDPEFEESLRNLHNNFNLIYGAYDFIVTPKGEHVFLEVNPVGQWLWLEEELGLDISQSIADLLSSACKN
jgi:glutathione synthase/RimK-type ligase-like ATP-grasp enzyme